MLQREHSAILSTFIKLPFVIKIFVLSIFEWPPKTGFTVLYSTLTHLSRMEFPSLVKWTSPFSFKGMLGGILFYSILIEHFISKQ